MHYCATPFQVVCETKLMTEHEKAIQEVKLDVAQNINDTRSSLNRLVADYNTKVWAKLNETSRQQAALNNSMATAVTTMRSVNDTLTKAFNAKINLVTSLKDHVDNVTKLITTLKDHVANETVASEQKLRDRMRAIEKDNEVMRAAIQKLTERVSAVEQRVHQFEVSHNEVKVHADRFKLDHDAQSDYRTSSMTFVIAITVINILVFAVIVNYNRKLERDLMKRDSISETMTV